MMLSRVSWRHKFSSRLSQPCGTSITSFVRRWYGVRDKVTDLDDAVAIVKNYDSLCVSGFVAQSCPEALLRALGERFDATGSPRGLSLLFGGGPGDFASKGLNHLAKPGLLTTAIGAHYGQVPEIAKLVLANEIAGYALPLGSISRMIRQKASHSPGHITRVGLGTMVDPRQSGGALNAKAARSPVVEVITLDSNEYLRYRSVPINVCFIRATTADPEGNLTFEKESILGDAKIIAMATRSSGGVVIAQVERIAAHGSLPSRSVHIPGLFVDCVVVAEAHEHGVSYFMPSNPVWSGEIREPVDNITPMPLTVRKIIARRAAMELRPDDIVNLGIGMPEGVASVASEEGLFKYVTLTTEAGVIGGVGASGKNFGPGSNPEAFNEMHQQFDLYNGGGLSICFLGMAETDPSGSVNVSRLSNDSLTGPGGFIDISQCTHQVVFMGTFSKQGLKVKIHEGGVTVEQEGSIKAFKEVIRETTFAAKQALLNGQKVLYVTERCVFELNYRGLKLVEIAPGVDLEKDILAQMDVPPYIKDRNNIRLMDERIFKAKPMNLYDDIFSLEKAAVGRLVYNEDTRTLFMDWKNYIIHSAEQIVQMEKLLASELERRMSEAGGQKINVVVNYDGFDCKSRLTEAWANMAARLQAKYYASIKRYSGRIFRRQKLGEKLGVESDEDYWHSFAKGGEVLARPELVSALEDHLHLKPSAELVNYLMDGEEILQRGDFGGLLKRLNWYRHHGKGRRFPATSKQAPSDD